MKGQRTISRILAVEQRIRSCVGIDEVSEEYEDARESCRDVVGREVVDGEEEVVVRDCRVVGESRREVA